MPLYAECLLMTIDQMTRPDNPIGQQMMNLAVVFLGAPVSISLAALIWGEIRFSHLKVIEQSQNLLCTKAGFQCEFRSDCEFFTS
jgi:hypothetical protein